MARRTFQVPVLQLEPSVEGDEFFWALGRLSHIDLRVTGFATNPGDTTLRREDIRLDGGEIRTLGNDHRV